MVCLSVSDPKASEILKSHVADPKAREILKAPSGAGPEQGWPAGPEQRRSRAGAGPKQGESRAGTGPEQGQSKAPAALEQGQSQASPATRPLWQTGLGGKDKVGRFPQLHLEKALLIQH